MFKPGVSGNPGGRPAVIGELRDLARTHTPDAIKTLAGIMMQPKASATARVAAACAILDRGWGKPMQPTELTAKLTLEKIVAASLGLADAE